MNTLCETGHSNSVWQIRHDACVINQNEMKLSNQINFHRSLGKEKLQQNEIK